MLVSGRVQGVFFRVSMRRVAQQVGVSGWVRNLPDGRVEAHVQGPADAIAALVDWTHEGPRGAHVTDVEVTAVAPIEVEGFEVRS